MFAQCTCVNDRIGIMAIVYNFFSTKLRKKQYDEMNDGKNSPSKIGFIVIFLSKITKKSGNGSYEMQVWECLRCLALEFWF